MLHYKPHCENNNKTKENFNVQKEFHVEAPLFPKSPQLLHVIQLLWSAIKLKPNLGLSWTSMFELRWSISDWCSVVQTKCSFLPSCQIYLLSNGAAALCHWGVLVVQVIAACHMEIKHPKHGPETRCSIPWRLQCFQSVKASLMNISLWLDYFIMREPPKPYYLCQDNWLGIYLVPRLQGLITKPFRT